MLALSNKHLKSAARLCLLDWKHGEMAVMDSASCATVSCSVSPEAQNLVISSSMSRLQKECCTVYSIETLNPPDDGAVKVRLHAAALS